MRKEELRAIMVARISENERRRSAAYAAKRHTMAAMYLGKILEARRVLEFLDELI